VKPWLALVVTLGILIATAVASELLEAPLALPMILLTALWAAIDSTRLQLKRYKSGISYGPVLLFFAVALLWIVGFPWYLIVRYKIKSGAAVLKEQPITDAA